MGNSHPCRPRSAPREEDGFFVNMHRAARRSRGEEEARVSWGGGNKGGTVLGGRPGSQQPRSGCCWSAATRRSRDAYSVQYMHTRRSHDTRWLALFRLPHHDQMTAVHEWKLEKSSRAGERAGVASGEDETRTSLGRGSYFRQAPHAAVCPTANHPPPISASIGGLAALHGRILALLSLLSLLSMGGWKGDPKLASRGFRRVGL
jgi:hypothetical protein